MGGVMLGSHQVDMAYSFLSLSPTYSELQKKYIILFISSKPSCFVVSKDICL